MAKISRPVKSMPAPTDFGGAPGPAKRRRGFVEVKDKKGNVIAHFPQAARAQAVAFASAYKDSTAIQNRHLADVAAVDRGRQQALTAAGKTPTRAERVDAALSRVMSPKGGSFADSLLAGSREPSLSPAALRASRLRLLTEKRAATEAGKPKKAQTPTTDKAAERQRKADAKAEAARKKKEETLRAQQKKESATAEDDYFAMKDRDLRLAIIKLEKDLRKALDSSDGSVSESQIDEIRSLLLAAKAARKRKLAAQEPAEVKANRTQSTLSREKVEWIH